MKDNIQCLYSQLLILVGILLSGSAAHGQTQQLLAKRISLHVQQQPISAALDQIEHAAGLHFSYNSLLFNRNRKITISVDNQPVLQILKVILRDPTLRFNETEQDIIIYRPANLEAASQAFWREELARSKHQTTNSKEQNQKIDTVVQFQLVVDTVLDTVHIAVTDTNYIALRDTVWDTIRVQPMAMKATTDSAKWSLQAGGQLLFPSVQTATWATAIAADVQQLRSQEQQLPGGGAFAMLRFQHHGLCFSTGLRYAVLRSSYNYSLHRSWIDSLQYTSHYDTTTVNQLIDSYYEYTNKGDTIWHHNYLRQTSVTEKRNYKSDSVAINKQGTSQITLLQIPLLLGYAKPIGKALRVEIDGGLLATIVLGAKGDAIAGNKTAAQVNSAASLSFSKPYWSVCAQVQAAYRVAARWSVVASCYVDHCLQSVYSENNPISRKYTNLGLQLGIELSILE